MSNLDKYLSEVEARLAASAAEDVEGYPWYSEMEFLNMRLLPADAVLAANCRIDLTRLVEMVRLAYAALEAEIERNKLRAELDRLAKGEK